jgi:hypothetical protein
MSTFMGTPHSCVPKSPHGHIILKVPKGCLSGVNWFLQVTSISPSQRGVAETLQGMLEIKRFVPFKLVHDGKKAGSAAVGCRCHTCLTQKCPLPNAGPDRPRNALTVSIKDAF